MAQRAYVYRRSGTSWTQEAYIKAANNDPSDNFGYSVSLFADTLAVGASFESSNQITITNGTSASADNSLSASGAVYIYRRNGVIWAQEAYIKAANAGISDHFGSQISISGDSVAVGVFDEGSNQTTITNGASASVDNSSPFSGAVYVYRRNATSWAQESYIKAANADSGDYFGMAISIMGDTLAVGVSQERSNQATITNGATASSDNSFMASGAVYVYRRLGAVWAQEAYIKAANNLSNAQFGCSVSLSGDSLAVGAYGERSNQTTVTNGSIPADDILSNASGAAYIYQNTSRLFEVADLVISSPAVGQAKLDWKPGWGTGNQVIVAKLEGDTAPVDCSVGSGGVNLGNVLTITHTGLTSSSRYTYRVCTSDGTTMTSGMVISTTIN